MKRGIFIVTILLCIFVILFLNGKMQSMHNEMITQNASNDNTKQDLTEEKGNIPEQIALDITETKFISTDKTDEELKLSDVLDNKKEFYIGSGEDTKIIYLYVDFKDYYMEYIINVNYKEGRDVNIPLPEDAIKAYILCQEYSVVRSSTHSQSANLEEVMKYYVAASQDEQTVGGDMFFRVFEVNNPTAGTDCSFKMFNTWENEEIVDDTEVFGQFTITFNKDTN